MITYLLVIHFPNTQFYNILLEFDKNDLFDEDKLLKLKGKIKGIINKKFNEKFTAIDECTIINVIGV